MRKRDGLVSLLTLMTAPEAPGLARGLHLLRSLSSSLSFERSACAAVHLPLELRDRPTQGAPAASCTLDVYPSRVGADPPWMRALLRRQNVECERHLFLRRKGSHRRWFTVRAEGRSRRDAGQRTVHGSTAADAPQSDSTGTRTPRLHPADRTNCKWLPATPKN